MISNFDAVQAGAFYGAGVITQGNVYYVRPYGGSNGNDGKSPDYAFRTLAYAKSVAVADHNDVVIFMSESNTAANTTDYQSTVLDWSKDGVHLLGIGSGVINGSRARISNLSTATAIVSGLVIVSADNCHIEGIGIFHGQGGTNPSGASIALSVTGQRNKIVDCQISGIGHSELDDSTSRSLKVSGSENHFKGCYIGLDTVIRATATAEVEIAASAARTVFEDCTIASYTSLTTFKAVAATSIDRYVMFKNCIFYAAQGITSSVAPTGAISNTTPNGQIYGFNSGVFGYADVTTADDTATLWLGHYATTVVDMGVAKATDVA